MKEGAEGTRHGRAEFGGKYWCACGGCVCGCYGGRHRDVSSMNSSVEEVGVVVL